MEVTLLTRSHMQREVNIMVIRGWRQSLSVTLNQERGGTHVALNSCLLHKHILNGN